MFDYIRKHNPGEHANQAYSMLPVPVMSPREAYERIVKNEVELVPAGELAGRVAANSVIPYPPGIPMLMSGENFGSETSPQITYLKSLANWDQRFPGFEYETEGTTVNNGEIEFVAAFDIDQRKVGLPLSQAIFALPNCARVFQQEIKEPCTVQQGPILDGVAPHMEYCHDTINFKPSREKPVDVTRELIDREVDILINYLPVGSEQATAHYARSALDAGVAFLNCIPVFIASNPVWEQKFINAGLPLIGDDMRSQFGASYFSQLLQEGLFDRGHQVLFHCQTNVGGNTDFANMVDQSRLASKKISKENVIRAQNDIRDISVPKDGIYAGPSSFIPYLKDNKVANIRVEALGFGGAPLTIDARLSVQDSENSAGVVIDAIRYLQVAREMNIVGALRGPSAWTQKTPPEQMMNADAKRECEALARREYTDLTGSQVMASEQQG